MYENEWASSTQASTEQGVMYINNRMQYLSMVRKNMKLNVCENRCVMSRELLRKTETNSYVHIMWCLYVLMTGNKKCRGPWKGKHTIYWRVREVIWIKMRISPPVKVIASDNLYFPEYTAIFPELLSHNKT